MNKVDVEWRAWGESWTLGTLAERGWVTLFEYSSEALSRGVDGLITDQPDLTRRVIQTRAELSDAQRFLVALLVRMGASTKVLASEDALRP